MCMTSAVGGYFKDNLPNKPYWPTVAPFINPSIHTLPAVSRQEFDALKRDLEELKKALAAAKHYDEVAGEPDCEVEDKVALIKRLADLVGVSMGDVLK